MNKSKIIRIYMIDLYIFHNNLKKNSKLNSSMICRSFSKMTMKNLN